MSARYVSAVGGITPDMGRGKGPWKECYCITDPCDCRPYYQPSSDHTRISPQGAAREGKSWLERLFESAGEAYQTGRDVVTRDTQKRVENAEREATKKGRIQAGIAVAAIAGVAFFALRK